MSIDMNAKYGQNQKMQRRKFLKNSAVAGAVGMHLLNSGKNSFAGEAQSKKLAAANGVQDERPNFLLVMADDLSWNGLNYMRDDDLLITPNIDQMAAENLRVDRFYACPVCSPARAASLTGRYPTRENVMSGGAMDDVDVALLPQILSGHGYATGHFGKWHLGTQSGMNPHERGYQETFFTGNNVGHVNPDRYSRGDEKLGEIEGDDSEILANELLAFIEKSKNAEKPFFATLWFHVPHSPHGSSQKYLDLYEANSKQEVYSDISAMDGAMGMIRSGLKELGVEENTVLFFNSDNGRYPSPKPLRGSKGWLYEGGVRTSGIVQWPKVIKSPRISQVPCSVVDFMPTILDILDISDDKVTKPQDGTSLLPLLKGEMDQRPKPLGFQWSHWSHDYVPAESSYAWIDNDWKFLITPEGLELFNLAEDSNEKNNVINANPDLAANMESELRNWIGEVETSMEGKDYLPTMVRLPKTKKSLIGFGNNGENFRFQMESMQPGALTVEVVLTNGKVVFRERHWIKGGQKSLQVHFPQLPEGGIIRIKQGKQTLFVRKVPALMAVAH